MINYINAIIVVGLLIGLLILRKRLVTQNRLLFVNSLVILVMLSAICLLNLTSLGIMSDSSNASNRDIIFVLDLTKSMNGVDGRAGGENRRIENARDDIKTIAKQNVGAANAVIVFDYDTRLLAPLSTNLNDLEEVLNTTEPPLSINQIPKVATYQQVADFTKEYLRKQYDLDPTRERVVVMLSDFEIFKDKEDQTKVIGAMKDLKQYAGGFVNVVYGNDQGAKMLQMDYDYTAGSVLPRYKSEYYRNNDVSFDTRYVLGTEPGEYGITKYVPTVSKPNFELAKKISSAQGGLAIRYTDTSTFEKSMIKASNSALKKSARNSKSQAMRQNWLYVPISLILFIWVVFFEIIKPDWIARVAKSTEGTDISSTTEETSFKEKQSKNKKKGQK